MKHLSALALATLSLLSATANAASDELSTGLALSWPFAPRTARDFAAWDVQAEYGLTESFLFGADLGAMHSLADGAPARFEVSPWLGLELDVVEWVPHIASGPLCVLRIEDQVRVDFGAQVSLGVDYRLVRSVSLGALYHFSATVGEDGGLLHRAGLRAMYHWGW